MANFTQREIKKSFIRLLNERPYNKITVRDIVEDCGINRNSFYYHFQDIPALIESIFIEETDKIIAEYPRIESLEVFVDALCELVLKNKPAMQHLFCSANRSMYEQYAMKLCQEMVTKFLDTAFPQLESDPNIRRICIESFKCMLFGFCIDWSTDNFNEDRIEDLHTVCRLLRKLPEVVIAEYGLQTN